MKWLTTALLVLLSFGVSTAYDTDANPDAIVQKFLDRMVRSIESKDVAVISGLFEPDFVLKGCKGVYDKKKIIALLEKLPTGTKFSFTLKSSQDTGSSIKYTVSITGFDKNEVIAEFILNKKDQQLESGSVPVCVSVRNPRQLPFPLPPFRLIYFILSEMFGVPPEFPRDFIMRRVAMAVNTNNRTIMELLFDDYFKFDGCYLATAGRFDIINQFMNKKSDFTYEFPSPPRWTNEGPLEFTVKTHGLVEDISALFWYDYDKKKIVSGHSTPC
uniref:NTF2-like domain-containing protein n=1 Tax=Caenorhabditis tropicalis TaxID=1561998 RepID=A0A1I7UEA1_9PELO